MKQISLTQGKYALVDDEDYDFLLVVASGARLGKWRINNTGYAQLSINGTYLLMHRFIIDAPAGMDVDHINRNKLDNRRSNLRVCTTQENQRNISVSKSNTSGVTGVHYRKTRDKWQARITLGYKRVALGSFKTFEEAIEARKSAEQVYFKQFAPINQERVG